MGINIKSCSRTIWPELTRGLTWVFGSFLTAPNTCFSSWYCVFQTTQYHHSNSSTSSKQHCNVKVITFKSTKYSIPIKYLYFILTSCSLNFELHNVDVVIKLSYEYPQQTNFSFYLSAPCKPILITPIKNPLIISAQPPNTCHYHLLMWSRCMLINCELKEKPKCDWGRIRIQSAVCFITKEPPRCKGKRIQGREQSGS